MTKREIVPRGPVDAVVSVPGSKSIANRALVLAALADGKTNLVNVPDGDDTEAMLAAITALGANVDRADNSVTIAGPIDLSNDSPLTLDAKLAGTTSRFLTALAALRVGVTTIDGGAALRNRPNADLRACLVGIGAHISGPHYDGLPVLVSRGKHANDHVRVRGDISSQFLSALLLVASSLPNGLRIEVDGPLVSRSYIEMTVEVMRAFGIEVTFDGASALVSAGKPLPRKYTIEADASSASYPMAAAAIAGGSVEVRGLGAMSMQADSVFRTLLAEMGCDVRVNQSTIVSRLEGTSLRGINANLAECSDLVPTLATVCCFADSPSEISGVGFIRRKESNRIEGLAGQLRALGADIEPTADGLKIRPSLMHGGLVDTMHDHRIAMALSLVGLRVSGVEIDSPEVVTKSWPGYWTMLDGL